MAEYHVRAQMLLNEGRLYPDSWRGPGYPLFLALLYALPGDDVLAARIGNALLAGLTAALTVVVARRLVDRRASLAAGAIVALYPGLILSSQYVMPEGLYAFLMMSTLVVATRIDPRRVSAVGVLTGATILTRSLGVALVPAVVGSHMVEAWRAGRWRRFVVGSGVLVLACLLTLVPWFRHTVRVSGGVMLDSASAYNMLAGNNPGASGKLDIANGNWVMATQLGGPIDEAERNRRAVSQTWTWISENPSTWLRLMPLKVGYLWGLEGREHAFLYSITYFGPRVPATVWTWGVLLLVSFPVLAVAAVVGLFREGLLSRTTGVQLTLLLAVVTILHVVSFGESRFHLPLVPVLAVLAAYGFASRVTLSGLRLAGCALLLALLALAWSAQAPELMSTLRQLAHPDGWRSWQAY